MAVAMNESPYVLYSTKVRPWLARIANTILACSMITLIFVAIRLVIVSSTESGSEGAQVLITLVALSGLCICSLAWAGSDRPLWYWIAPLAAVCALIAYGKWHMGPATYTYSEAEVRITEDRQVVRRGTVVERGVWSTKSRAIKIVQLPNSFSATIPDYRTGTKYRVRYSITFADGDDLRSFVQVLIDRSTIPVSDLAAFYPMLTTYETLPHVRVAVLSGLPLSGGHEVPHTIKHIRSIRIESVIKHNRQP